MYGVKVPINYEDNYLTFKNVPRYVLCKMDYKLNRVFAYKHIKLLYIKRSFTNRPRDLNKKETCLKSIKCMKYSHPVSLKNIIGNNRWYTDENKLYFIKRKRNYILGRCKEMN